MLLIAEIVLTVAAWRKGWKGWALLPMALVVGLGFVIGFVAGADNVTDGTLLALGLILDLSGIGALIIMTARAPKRMHHHRNSELLSESV